MAINNHPTRKEFLRHLARVIRYASSVLDDEIEGDHEIEFGILLFDELLWLLLAVIPGDGIADQLVKRIAEGGRDSFVEFFVKLDDDDDDDDDDDETNGGE